MKFKKKLSVQQSKPYILFVPSEIESDIKKHFKRNRDVYYFIVFSLINSAVHNKDIEFGHYIPFNVSKIEKIISRKPDYYIKNLEKYDIINCDKKYKRGQKAFHYKLNPKYNIDCNTIEIKPTSKIFDNIYKQTRNRKKNINKLPGHLYPMAKKFNDIDLNYEDAYNWINTINEPEKRLLYSMAVEQFRDKRTRYFKRNKRNYRLDTNLTNLKKELRTFLQNDFISIDLKNSQPFFLSIILNQLIKQSNNHNSQRYGTIMLEVINLDPVKWFGNKRLKNIQNVVKNGNFQKLRHFDMFQTAKNGSFYETFQKEFEGNLKRDEVKKIMFGVLYSRNVFYKDFQRFIPYRKEKENFAKVYPIEYEIIKELKQRQHEDLAVYMQRIESFIFIDCIAKELVNSNIIPITIHDSVIIERENYSAALEIIKKIFKEKTGTIPSFQIEEINQEKQEKELLRVN